MPGLALPQEAANLRLTSCDVQPGLVDEQQAVGHGPPQRTRALCDEL
jgi:hypothetical protein